MQEMMKASISPTFDKIDDETRTVYGFFGDDSVDTDEQIIFREDFIPAFQEWLQWGNIRNNHGDPVGVVVSSFDPNESWNYFGVKIVDDRVWNLVKEKVYKGFSIGIKADPDTLTRVPLHMLDASKYDHLPKAVVKRIVKRGYVTRIGSFYIYEISICDKPKNTRARILKGEGVEDVLAEEYGMENIENTVEDQVGAIQQDVITDTPVTESVVIDAAKSETEIAPVVESTTTVDVIGNSSEPLVTMSEFSKGMKTIEENIQMLMDAVREIGKEKEPVAAKPEPELQAVAKSETMATETSPTEISPALMELVKGFIAETVEKTVKEMTEPLIEARKGAVNQGAAQKVEKRLDVTGMNKQDAYGEMAKMIARTMKGV